MAWYKITAKAPHRGAGRNDEQTAYVWSGDAMRARQSFKRESSVSSRKIYSVRELSPEELPVLFDEIRKRGISSERAKKMSLRYYHEIPPI